MYIGYAKPSKPNVCLLLPIRGAVPAYYFCVSTTPQGQAKLKELARTSRSHIARDALLLLVHPEWRKSRSTPQPFTLFSSRCYDAYCTACVVSTFAICFHEPVFPSNGVRGNKESYGLEGGASAFRRYPLQSSEGGKEKTNSEMERKSSLGRLRGG
jgi:hypothetical protein